MIDAPHTRQQLAAPFLPGVALLLAAVAALAACGDAATGARGKPPSVEQVKRQNKSRPAATPEQEARAPYGAPARLATLEDEAVRESSGLAASRRNPGLFWTHNDSGAAPLLHAFDRDGRRRGVWRVAGAASIDWEDMDAGPGPQPGVTYLYVGDIGDNKRRREEIVVYRVAEPEITPADAQTSARAPRETEPAAILRLRYPDGAHDAEALLVHPSSGDLYVVTKEIVGGAGVYKLAAPPSVAPSVNTLKRVGEVRLPVLFGGLVTGGDISPDGRRVVLCDYTSGYEFVLPGGGAATAGFDGVWNQSPLAIDFGERQQGEAVCYGADGESIFATSEKRPVPFIEVRRAALKK
ncbi:MAG TPA: hypothetical protein VF240_04985 [Pyrinomonadaceae bacterium]